MFDSEINSYFLDNMILYGGGWNSQRDPVDKKLVKPYYGYYGLEALESPWKFKVVEAAQKIPAPDRSAHKGQYLSDKPVKFQFTVDFFWTELD